MSYTINDLRDDLAGTIRALRDTTNPMPIDRAKAVAEVAQTMINSAKVEVDMVNAVGSKALQPSGFIPTLTSSRPAIEHGAVPSASPVERESRGMPPAGPSARL